MIDKIIQLFATDDPERHELGLELLKGQRMSFVDVFDKYPIFIEAKHIFMGQQIFGCKINPIYNPVKKKPHGFGKFFYLGELLQVSPFKGVVIKSKSQEFWMGTISPVTWERNHKEINQDFKEFININRETLAI